jgi:uncharacterized membrane protein
MLAAIGAVAVAALVGVTAWAWPQLPGDIAIHFNTRGEPDGWGSRWLLLLLPFLGTAIFAALIGLARFPWTFNYPWAITPENAQRQYLLARRFMLALGVLPPVIFLRLVLGTVAVTLGEAIGLGSLAWDLLPMMALIGAYCFMAWLRR